MGQIRRARSSDVPMIHELLDFYAKINQLLPRSMAQLYDNLRDFIVYVEGQQIIGVCSLHVCWEQLAEIRSFCVKKEFQGKGIGRDLVLRCLEDCEELEISSVFVLTYIPKYFEKLGFSIIDKALLPHKIWADCIHCVKFPKCDEVALLLELKDYKKASHSP
jgi:amino-acid N-acetyltransferase